MKIPMQNLFKKKLRLYLDTSIPNYLFAEDLPDKMKSTMDLFRAIKDGKVEACISEVVVAELNRAPEPKRTKLIAKVTELSILPLDEEAVTLANEYIANKIIPPTYRDDARHVAIATVNNLDAVVSWNYGHLVNINKTKRINIINEIMGYKHMSIVSPEEVV